MKKLLVIAMAIFLLPVGCTWVRLTPEGQQVRVASESEVADCRLVGRTTVSLLHNVAGIKRNHKKVAIELETLARNEAVDLEGDTIMPASAIKDGEQCFAVYRCSNP